MEEDEELRKVRSRKLEEAMRKAETEQSPALAKPLEMTDQNFSEVVKKNALVVIDCWASWCAPCRVIGPIIEELAKDYAGKILFGKLNVDSNLRVPLEYQIMSIPTILVFKNGKLVNRIVGARPRNFLESQITHYL